MGNSSSRNAAEIRKLLDALKQSKVAEQGLLGQISRLEDALKQSSVVEQTLRGQMRVTEAALQKLQEQINVAALASAATLAGGGALLLLYILKNKFFPSETSLQHLMITSNSTSVVLPDPWRTIHETETDFSKIKDFYLRKIVNICNDQDTELNILLLSQTATGKASFVNSCKTVLRQTGTNITIPTVLEGCSDFVSRHLLAHGLKVRDGGYVKLRLPVRLFDCRGLLDENRGVQTEDIISICDGHIKDEYEIQPETPISSDNPKYREDPEMEDEIHCVVYVIDAQNGDNFVRERVKEQFEDVKKHLHKSQFRTPQLILLTKIGRLGVRDNVFYDKRVQKCCEKASSFLGFPLDDVLPQATYYKETISTEEQDCITLYNIWKIMEKAKDYVQRRSEGSAM